MGFIFVMLILAVVMSIELNTPPKQEVQKGFEPKFYHHSEIKITGESTGKWENAVITWYAPKNKKIYIERPINPLIFKRSGMDDFFEKLDIQVSVVRNFMLIDRCWPHPEPEKGKTADWLEAVMELEGLKTPGAEEPDYLIGFSTKVLLANGDWDRTEDLPETARFTLSDYKTGEVLKEVIYIQKKHSRIPDPTNPQPPTIEEELEYVIQRAVRFLDATKQIYTGRMYNYTEQAWKEILSDK